MKNLDKMVNFVYRLNCFEFEFIRLRVSISHNGRPYIFHFPFPYSWLRKFAIMYGNRVRGNPYKDLKTQRELDKISANLV